MRPSDHSAPTHVDADLLGLLALGEDLPGDDVDHVDRCSRCHAEVDALRAVVVAARSGADVPAVVPPARVWDRVAAATGVRVDRREALGDGAAAGPEAAPHQGAVAAPEDPVAVPDEAAGAVPVTAPVEAGGDELASRRRRRASWLPLAAVAAAGLVLGTAVGVTVGRGDAGQDDATVLEQARLDPLVPGAPADGAARVVEAGGARELRLSVPGLSNREDGFYEVWLLADSGQMVPVGALVGGDARLPLPPGLDVAAYPVVDVSLEPYDGDPTHSGDSLLRGSLRT